jgi:DNA modification methylase
MARDLVRCTVTPGVHVVDPFASSGSLGEAAAGLGRRALVVGRDPDLAAPMAARVANDDAGRLVA